MCPNVVCPSVSLSGTTAVHHTALCRVLGGEIQQKCRNSHPAFERCEFARPQWSVRPCEPDGASVVRAEHHHGVLPQDLPGPLHYLRPDWATRAPGRSPRLTTCQLSPTGGFVVNLGPRLRLRVVHSAVLKFLSRPTTMAQWSFLRWCLMWSQSAFHSSSGCAGEWGVL